jgi:hypothetical protein
MTYTSIKAHSMVGFAAAMASNSYEAMNQ